MTGGKSKGKKAIIELAFDVGHSSIGWAVLKHAPEEILGCGAVIFPADDCLASSRRTFRRQRRHIRSTRQRIERIKILLENLGVMSRDELDRPGCAWPWLLAARVLREGPVLTWRELWDVLRWYAHNRGYDGNRAWSAQDADAMSEDVEKVNNARALYEKYGTHTMAETFCAVCGLDPLAGKKSCALSGDKRPKALNAAFPREDVESEVRRILNRHVGVLPCITDGLIQTLMDDATAIPSAELSMPLRYRGGLLFGQLIPRFENRIIETCPIMYERVFQQTARDAGESDRADAAARKAAKVPSKKCREFHDYRWAMQVANIQVESNGAGILKPLLHNIEWVKAVDRKMAEKGYLAPSELKKEVRALTGGVRDNLEQMLMHEDAQKSLVVDPVRKLTNSNTSISAVWDLIPERNRQRAIGKWRKGKALSLNDILMDVDAVVKTAVRSALEERVDAGNRKKRKSSNELTVDQVLEKRHLPEVITGRAPYHREVMRQAVEDVFERGIHPMEEGGALYRSGAIRETQLRRAIDNQTNNHLVRHRLKILERLHADIIREYAKDDKGAVRQVTIEVNRDVKELSGKTAKEVAQDMGSRLSDFKSVSKRLDGAFEGQNVQVGPGLIRKARIAEDLGWKCPFTGKAYDEFDLLNRKVDVDHIIPRSLRPSNSLDSLVITFSEINRWKGVRTALRFMEDEQGKEVPGMPNLMLKTLSRYKSDIERLGTRGPHEDDQRRKKNRKRLLLLKEYVEKEFVPRDLTQTSQLVRLGAQVLQRTYQETSKSPVITSIPGGVTGATRRSWDLMGCLSLANPEVLNKDGSTRTKTEIRDITHLHHALDACVLALTAHYLPRDGGVWQALMRRRLSKAEADLLRAALGGMVRINGAGEWRLEDLPKNLKQQLRERLGERRVVQHIPKEMAGLRAEQNAWRVVSVQGGEVTLRQRVRQPDGTRAKKERAERVGKVVGLKDGKLKNNKSALVIPDNYGLALDPEPTIIPFHKVWPRLQELRARNGNAMPRVLRNGMLIRVPHGRYAGVWRIFSTKASEAVDIGFPDKCRLASKGLGQKREVRVSTLLKDGLEILATSYTGVASCPTTLST